MDMLRPKKHRPWLTWLRTRGAIAGVVIVISGLGVVVTANVLTRAPTMRAPARPGAVLTQTQTRVVDDLEAEHPQSFTEITGVRELRDGRILMVDRLERSVQILDLRTGTSEPLGRMGKGPGEYTLPVALIALAGDSSGIADEATRRILVVKPDATTGGVVPLYPSSLGAFDDYQLHGTAGDNRSLLYAIGINRGMVNGRTFRNDSAPILRWTPQEERADTAAWTSTQGTMITASSIRRVSNIAVDKHPFEGTDQWAVARDGRVAVVDPATYMIHWTDSDGRETVTGPIAFTPVPVTEGHKEEWRARMRRGFAVIVNDDNGRATVRPVRQIKDPESWPEYLPPFLDRSLKFAPDGKLWVRRTGPAGSRPAYDVIDPQARVIQQIVLPAHTRLVGFGSNGAIYVARLDEDDLEHLQRYRLN
jgi:hypothetical protein